MFEDDPEYLKRLEEIEKEVDSWPEWKFLGSGSIINPIIENDD